MTPPGSAPRKPDSYASASRRQKFQLLGSSPPVERSRYFKTTDQRTSPAADRPVPTKRRIPGLRPPPPVMTSSDHEGNESNGRPTAAPATGRSAASSIATTSRSEPSPPTARPYRSGSFVARAMTSAQPSTRLPIASMAFPSSARQSPATIERPIIPARSSRGVSPAAGSRAFAKCPRASQQGHGAGAVIRLDSHMTSPETEQQAV